MSLPHEVLLQVLSYLGTAEDLCNASKVYIYILIIWNATRSLSQVKKMWIHSTYLCFERCAKRLPNWPETIASGSLLAIVLGRIPSGLHFPSFSSFCSVLFSALLSHSHSLTPTHSHTLGWQMNYCNTVTHAKAHG